MTSELQPKNRLIRVALYKNSKSFFGRVIRVQQYIQEIFYSRKHTEKFSDNWKYSHAEIVFCDLKKEEEERILNSSTGDSLMDLKWSKMRTRNRRIKNIFFSSSEEDGGVRFKNIIPKPHHWDFVEIPVSENQYSRMLERAIKMNGQNYSKWGIIFAQAFSLNFSKSNEKFCSQTVSILLNEAFGTEFSKIFFEKYTHFINPLKLARRLEKFLSE